MKRLWTNFGVAVLTFSVGTASLDANPLKNQRSAWTEPLLVTLIP